MNILISTGITWALTALTKNGAIGQDNPNRIAFVRALAALFALASSVGVAYFSHTSFDTSLVGIFVDSLATWFAAIGIYHAPKPV